MVCSKFFYVTDFKGFLKFILLNDSLGLESYDTFYVEFN